MIIPCEFISKLLVSSMRNDVIFVSPPLVTFTVPTMLSAVPFSFMEPVNAERVGIISAIFLTLILNGCEVLFPASLVALTLKE